MAKRIVICSDGTWNQPDQEHPTNVVKMARAVAKVDGDGMSQVVFYDPGVGSSGGIWSRLVSGATGKGLDKNIQDAYHFLIHNYEPGDEIFLFGFSRGAYTVRSTVGFIRNVGLLRKEHADKLPDAFALYRRRDSASHPKEAEAARFRAEHSHEIAEIKFLGVWDTVGALGIPVRGLRRFTMRHRMFHDVQLSGIVRNAYQALAIDERRVPFKPSVWRNPDSGQTVEQVWFVGVHTDVGGGNPSDGLADVAFEWLSSKAKECGLALNQEYIAARIDPYPWGPRHTSMSWAYRILGQHIRPMGGLESADTENAHRTATQRREDSVFSYDPSNLQTYLKGNPERIVG